MRGDEKRDADATLGSHVGMSGNGRNGGGLAGGKVAVSGVLIRTVIASWIEFGGSGNGSSMAEDEEDAREICESACGRLELDISRESGSGSQGGRKPEEDSGYAINLGGTDADLALST